MRRRDYLKSLAAAPFVSTDVPDAVSVDGRPGEEVITVDTSAGAVTVTLSDSVDSDRVKIIRNGEHPVYVRP